MQGPRRQSDDARVRDRLWALRLRARLASLRAHQITREMDNARARLERTRRDVAVLVRRTNWLATTDAPLPRIVAKQASAR